MVMEKIYPILNEMNRGLDMVQTYIDIYQRPIQTVRQLDIYLTSLESHFYF